MTREFADYVAQDGHPVDGQAVDAYRADRFPAGHPVEGEAPPAGGPDAGPVTSGPAFGGFGEFRLTFPDNVAMWVHSILGGVHTWAYVPRDQDTPGTYIHDQGAAAALWPIAHSLGRWPSVTVVDSGGSKVEGDVAYPDANHIEISFAAPMAGRAFLN